MNKWQMTFRTNWDKDNNRLEIFACNRHINKNLRVECIPMYQIQDTMIMEGHTTISLDYYHTQTKPLTDLETLNRFKRHLERYYKQSIETKQRLIRGF